LVRRTSSADRHGADLAKQQIVESAGIRRAATESAGHLLDENNDAFIKAGFYRAIQPRRFGGYEFHLRDFIRIMIAVARGCPSSGWVLALTAGHPQMLSRLPNGCKRKSTATPATCGHRCGRCRAAKQRNATAAIW
jgi:alkylation response protein AidB-like acyl-CoA dehydrogenase